MATRTAGLKVVLDGEKEYKQAIQDLNKGNQVLASEMRKLQEEYKGSEGSIEALNAKGELLQRQLLQQKDKVQTLREALQHAAEKYGESDKRTQDWQIQLNNAERQQFKLEHALEETNKEISTQNDAIDDENKKLGGLGDQLDGIVGKLGIQIPSAARDALNGMDGFSVGTVAAMGAAAGAIATVFKAVEALHQMTLEAAAKADELLTRSSQTGLSTELLQGLDYAGRFLDFDGLEENLSKLTASMDKARDGAAKQSEAFDALGVSVVGLDGQLLDNWEVFQQVISALGDVENATERDALANDLFGKSYSELKPLIDAGTEALQEYMDAAKTSGKILTDDQIKILGEVDDAYQELEAQIEATKNELAVEFAPTSKAAMDTFSMSVKKGGDMLTESGLVQNIGSTVQGMLSLLDAGMALVDSLPSWLNPIESLSQQFKGLAIVLATVADSVDLLSGLLPWNWGSGKASTALGWNISSGQMSHLQQLKYADSKYVSYNAAGTESWRGGLTWVGEQGPELVDLPQGARIYSNTESLHLAETENSKTADLLGIIVQLLSGIYSDSRDQRIMRRMM